MAPETCSTCGRPLDGGELHGLCPSCLLQQGALDETTDLDRRCTSCQNPLADDARFCPRCGAAAPVFSHDGEDPLRQALEAKLGAQYRVLRLLGRGGMGAVYLARDLTLEREVAIKVVKAASDEQRMYDRFRREAKTAAKLSHPNIVPLHAFGEVDGMPYFVMGYVRGESLADRLRRDGKLEDEEARRILAEIAEALDHAHRQGVVHRDVKPDNVLLEDASGRAMLTDFGIAKTMSRGETLTQHGSVVGTPHYMSPEQAAGRADIDGRTDLYSLGVMGYVMLAGRLPFDGKSVADILAGHLTQEPPPLRSIVPTISDSMLLAIERCLAKDPAKRWQDGRSLREALGETEDSGLPDALESTRGHGVAFVAIGVILLLLQWMVVIRLQHAPVGVLGIAAAGILACYVMVVVHLRLDGFPMALTQRVIWTEPAWWPLWYPRALRRRNNVWDRLPMSVRRLRWVTLIMFLSFAATALNAGENFARKLALFSVVFVVGLVLDFGVKRDLKRRGVASVGDRERIAYWAPPSRTTFWNQPQIAAILAPAKQGEVVRRGDSPHDHLHAILSMADELSGSLRPLGTEAASAARRLISAIEQSEKQIADLVRNIEAGEEQRLAEKIEALSGLEEAAPMRMLLEKQLELIRTLNARIEEAKKSRSRHMEMLKTLALHLTALRSRLADAPSQIASLSDNVRALCERISERSTNDDLQELPTVEQKGR